MKYARLYKCHKSNTPLNKDAVCHGQDCSACNMCGWNPEVSNRRKQRIRAMANTGRLAEWGM